MNFSKFLKEDIYYGDVRGSGGGSHNSNVKEAYTACGLQGPKGEQGPNRLSISDFDGKEIRIALKELIKKINYLEDEIEELKKIEKVYI